MPKETGVDFLTNQMSVVTCLVPCRLVLHSTGCHFSDVPAGRDWNVTGTSGQSACPRWSLTGMILMYCTTATCRLPASNNSMYIDPLPTLVVNGSYILPSFTDTLRPTDHPPTCTIQHQHQHGSRKYNLTRSPRAHNQQSLNGCRLQCRCRKTGSRSVAY